MSDPSRPLPGTAPFWFVFDQLDEAVTDDCMSARRLGEIISDAGEKTRAAVVRRLDASQDEVAAACLLAGVNTIMLDYHRAFEPLGASLCAEVDAILAAWKAYGGQGHWEPPPHAIPAAPTIAPPVIGVQPPRKLAAGERITATYTEALIATSRATADGMAESSRDFFADTARHPISDAELIEFLDAAVTNHTAVFATLHVARAKAMHAWIDAVQTSHETYQQTSQWANPVMTAGTVVAQGNP